MGSSIETKKINPQDHISRYCKRSCISEDGRIMRTAFMLRPAEEFISVNWLEYFKFNNRRKEIQEIRNAFEQKGYNTKRNDKFAVLKIAEMVDYVYKNSPDSRQLIIKHRPEINDPSHSGIFGLKDEHDQLIAALIVEVIREREIYPVKE